MSYPPEWATVVHAAKGHGWLNEKGLQLFLSEHGRQWLTLRTGPSPSLANKYSMTKIAPQTRLALKDLAHDTGVPMQEAIGHVIMAIHENRDALTRTARANGLTYPWEAIGRLVKGR
jgi:hypothetical protein